MNTPSKEALDAAENVQDYLGFPRRATMDLAAIIDRHFEPLRQRLAEMASSRQTQEHMPLVAHAFSNTADKLGAVLARHAAGEPEAQT